MKLIGVVGFISSGKSTVGDCFALNSYTKVSFSDTLKDSTSALFGWDRVLLEGDTTESRNFRDVVDEYWSKKLNREITPRKILQTMGTEVIRDTFHQDFWIMALEKRLKSSENYVISDCRFNNEMEWVKSHGGKIIRVRRGDDPVWFNDAIKLNDTKYIDTYSDLDTNIKTPPVHISEWKWIKEESYYDYVVDNNSTIEELHNKINEIIKDI